MTRKIFRITALVVLLVCFEYLSAQNKFYPDRQGIFRISNNLNRCPDFDDVLYSRNLSAIVEWFHIQQPCFNPPTGFDADVSMSGNLCDQKKTPDTYGKVGRITFSFHYFYEKNGKLETATGWLAPVTELIINNPACNTSQQLDECGFRTGDPPQLKQQLENSLANLKQYYLVDPVEKEIAPGVKKFVEGNILVFNPNRPWIWKPVTVSEIMEAKLAYYKEKQAIDSVNYEKSLEQMAKLNFKPEKTIRPMLYDLMKKEYESFPKEDLEKAAFSSPSDENISGINATGEGRPVMKFNPECWDHTLPVTTVQFISLVYKPQTELELEQFKKRNSGCADFVGLYMNSLPVEKLNELLQKK